ncbi:hypothetical protein ACSAZL_14615 [Methanosarcina sp. T3]
MTAKKLEHGFFSIGIRKVLNSLWFPHPSSWLQGKRRIPQTC